MHPEYCADWPCWELGGFAAWRSYQSVWKLSIVDVAEYPNVKEYSPDLVTTACG